MDLGLGCGWFVCFGFGLRVWLLLVGLGCDGCFNWCLFCGFCCYELFRLVRGCLALMVWCSGYCFRFWVFWVWVGFCVVCFLLVLVYRLSCFVC